VDDARASGPTQMTRTVFLTSLREAATNAASEILGPAWSKGGCPYLEAWFARHSDDDAASLERMAQRYAGPASRAEDYIESARTRLREGLALWSRGVDIDSEIEAAGLEDGVARRNVGNDSIMAKEMAGTHFAEPDSLAHVVRQLDGGSSLDGAVATKMGNVFSEPFGNVRVHADPTAARLAGRMNARAFTVGSHIAFATGEYDPHGLTGQALIAHELAHVVQQRSARIDAKAFDGAPRELQGQDREADLAALTAMTRLYPSEGREIAARSLNARPLLRSPLALQSCKRGKEEIEPPPKRPQAKKSAKDLTKGRMAWNLEPSGNNSAQIQISFTPKVPVKDKTLTFLQTVLYTKPEGREYGLFGEELGPKFEAGSDKRRVDFGREEDDPFYGAAWGGTKWVPEGLNTEDTSAGLKNKPSSSGDATAYMFDRPSTNRGERQVFESVPVIADTGENFGSLKWGLEYGKHGADRWKLLGAEPTDCVDAPTKDFGAAVEKFYDARFDVIVDQFSVNDSTLTPGHKASLDPIAKQLKTDTKRVALCGGFADATESDPTTISQARAQSVKDYLVSAGAPAPQVKIAGAGAIWARYPVSATESRNRRVQVIVTTREEEVKPETAPSGSGGGARDAATQDSAPPDSGKPGRK